MNDVAPRRWIAAVALVVAAALVGAAHAQQTIRITGDRLSGFVLPVEPLDGAIRLEARRGFAWTVDDTKRLLLQDDVSVTVAGRTLTGDAAVIWLNRIPSADGLINQIAVFFDRAGQPTGRAGLGAEGRNLLVTASARGAVTLSVARLEERPPRASGLLQRGEARLAEHLRRLLADPPGLEQEPRVEIPPRPDEFFPVPGGRVRESDVDLPEEVELPPTPATLPLLPPSGVVRWAAEDLQFTRGDGENLITANGSLVVHYVALDRTEDYSTLTLSAERGVIFVRPGSVEELVGQLDAEAITGIYLEGGVWVSVDDGDYIARAPRAYYDFRTQQAVMVDAVLRTYVRDTSLPVYARARELRQIALNQWEARDVRVSTSEFRQPHLSLGSDRLTVTRRPMASDPEQRETYLEGERNTLRVGGTPVLGWPRFAGTVDDVPLRRVTVGTRDNDGLSIETSWDLYALSGQRAPDGVEARLEADVFTERGAGLGVDYRFDAADGYGALDLYGMYDDGTDRTSSGREVDPGSGVRGVVLWERFQRLPRDWTLATQLSWISDETFITARREDDFLERREYETSVYLKNQSGSQAFDLLVQYELNDFISNDYLLASRQTLVDKLPELSLRRYGDSWFDGKAVYSGETRVTRMRFAFEEHSTSELGVRPGAFGIAVDTPLSSALRAEGFSASWVNRFDSRHEITMPRRWGAVRMTPFIVGRLTAYDDDFEEFSSDDDADDTRLFGAVGIRLHTQLQRVDDTASNRLLDINRLRHIVEPSVTLWYADATVDEQALPPYDPEVESLATGAAVRFGLRNVWQTQRGGPGRWRSVDFLTLDVDTVFTSSDANRESPAARFFDYRPEYSQLGDHVRSVLMWLPSDNVSVVGEQTVDLDESAIARGSIGAELRHSRDLATYVEYRYIDASDNRLLGMSWDYQMTPLYRLRLRPQWDFVEDDFRSLTIQVTRRFPDFDLTLQFRRDEVRNDTSVGASIDLVEF